MNTPTKLKSPEPFPHKYAWGCIPKTRLLPPNPQNIMITHPMDGFDVYKLIWMVKTSSKLSKTDCELMIYKLSKIKLLKDRYVKTNVLYFDYYFNFNNKRFNFFSELSLKISPVKHVVKNCIAHYVI